MAATDEAPSPPPHPTEAAPAEHAAADEEEREEKTNADAGPSSTSPFPSLPAAEAIKAEGNARFLASDWEGALVRENERERKRKGGRRDLRALIFLNLLFPFPSLFHQAKYDAALALTPPPETPDEAPAALVEGASACVVAEEGEEKKEEEDAAPTPSALLAATLHCNRAAALLRLGRAVEAGAAASAALALHPRYAKALLRRSAAAEAAGSEGAPAAALADAREAAACAAPGSAEASAAASAVARLEPLAAAAAEKAKAEMIGEKKRKLALAASPSIQPFPFVSRRLSLSSSSGKLKDLGNTLLGKVGLSLDNFKAVQDPSTGSYSISFQQQAADAAAVEGGEGSGEGA